MASKPSCIEDTSYEPLGHAPINFLISIYDTDNAGVYILLYHPILCSAELQRPWEMNRDVTAPQCSALGSGKSINAALAEK